MAEEARRGDSLAREIGLVLGRGQALRAALEASAEALAKRPGIALACLFTVEGEGAFLELAAARGVGSLPCAVGARLLIGTDRHGRAVQERRPIETRGDDPPVLLACPLTLAGEVNGLLAISSADPLPSELGAQLDALAALLGQAIARARVEQALQDTEARLVAVTEQIPAILWTLDSTLRVTSSMGRGLRALGLKPGEMVGRTLFDWAGTTDVSHPTLAFHLRALAGEVVTYDWNERGKDYETRLLPIRDEAGKITGVLGFGIDVSDRQRERHALLASEHKYRLVVENANEAIVVAQDGRLRFLNRKTEEITGFSREELLAMPFVELIHPEDRAFVMERHRRRLQGDTLPQFYSFRALRPDGSVRWVDVHAVQFLWEGRPGTLNFFTDVTEREQAQEALRESERRKDQERRHAEGVLHRAQKMESLGVLAGGVAHDFNNLLVAILGHADLAARELPKGSPLANRIEQIAIAATRAAELTGQMLVYAGKGKLVAQAIDLSGLVEEISRLLGAAISKKTRVEFQLAGEPPRIEGDPGQIRQVAMNLLTNASEAFEGREGVVSIRTGSLEADRAALSGMLLGEELPEGRYAFIEVEDHGGGMDQETLSRIFDPFFTTKFAGRGLGLAATLGIVRSHRGAIQVESEKGRGTLFRVLLPVPAQPVAETSKAEPAAAKQFSGAGKVLALDDEAGVLAVVKAMLGEAGFSVLTARSAPDGLDILRAAGQDVVLAVVDLSVAEAQPGLTEALRALRPELPILLSSSYVESEARGRVPEGAIDSFIQKPYRYAALVEAARRALEARA